MIKTLLNADEEPPPGTELVIEETVVNPPSETPTIESAAAEEASDVFETRQVFEIPEDAKFFAVPSETREELLEIPESSELTVEPPLGIAEAAPENLEAPEVETVVSSNIEQFIDEKTNDDASPTIFQSAYQPESAGETIRQSGLAYSAAIIFFVSVVFMLVIGWFADLLLGSSPWGIVGGIILGGIIGFVQFFRITSQIFKK